MIYFVQPVGGGQIKIGTTVRLSERLKQLVAEYGDLTVLAVVDGSFDVEGDLHQRFAHLRTVGEWFEPGDDLLGFIVAEGRKWDDLDDAPMCTIIVRGSAEWKAWVDQVAELNGAPLAVTIEQALRLLADRLGAPKPPRRVP